MIITIDGPSGTGKSTVAKGLAKALGITYFDTGALYRAISWKLIHEGVSYQDKESLKALLKSFMYHMQIVAGEEHYFVGDTDVTKVIRSSEVTAIVSEVSALKEVREELKPIQIHFAEGMDAVFEGRDLGTVVFPYADVKFFLTARSEVRAKRRYREFQQKFPNQSFSFETTLREIKERDRFDANRAIAPLKQAKDAILIDTSDLSVKKVIAYMKQIINEKNIL